MIDAVQTHIGSLQRCQDRHAKNGLVFGAAFCSVLNAVCQSTSQALKLFTLRMACKSKLFSFDFDDGVFES